MTAVQWQNESICRTARLGLSLDRWTAQQLAFARDKHGWTPVHHACLNGRLDALRTLIEAKVNPNAQSLKGVSALHVAVASNQPGAVRRLLHCKADVNAANDKGHTALFVAAEKGLDGVIRELVQHANPDVNVRSKKGWTPLLIAARKKKASTVRYLTQLKADLNACTNNGHSVLHITAQYGPAEAMRTVLEAQRNPLRTVCRLFFWHAKRKYMLVDWQVLKVVCLMASPAPVPVVNRPTAREVVVVTGIQPTDRTSQRVPNTTPLMIAACKGRTAQARLLLAAGAWPGVTEYLGRTPLSIAEACMKSLADRQARQVLAAADAEHLAGLRSTVALLKRATTPSCCPRDPPCASLCQAAERHTEDHSACARFLLRGKADVNMYETKVVPNRRPYASPLALAAETDNRPVARVLLSKGADVSGCERYSVFLLFRDAQRRLVYPRSLYHPLTAAVLNGHAHMADLLCEAGADVNKVVLTDQKPGDLDDRYQAPPLVAAVRGAHVETVAVLLRHKALTVVKDSNGKGALLHALSEKKKAGKKTAVAKMYATIAELLASQPRVTRSRVIRKKRKAGS